MTQDSSAERTATKQWRKPGRRNWSHQTPQLSPKITMAGLGRDGIPSFAREVLGFMTETWRHPVASPCSLGLPCGDLALRGWREPVAVPSTELTAQQIGTAIVSSMKMFLVHWPAFYKIVFPC